MQLHSIVLANLLVALAVPGVEPLNQAALMEEFNAAYALAGKLQYDEALPRIKAVIEKDPTFHLAYRALAIAGADAGRSAEVVTYFRSLIERNPHNALPWLGLATVDQVSLRSSDANWDACARANPEETKCHYFRIRPPIPTLRADRPAYWFTRAVYAQSRRKRDEAVRYSTRAVEVAEALGHKGDLPMLLQSMASSVALNGEHQEEMLQIFRRGVMAAQAAGDKQAEFDLKVLQSGPMIRLGQAQQARALLFDLLAEARERGSFRDIGNAAASLAHLCYHIGDYPCAREQWQTVVDNALGFDKSVVRVGALYRLSEAEIQAANPQAAIVHLEQALAVNYLPQRPFLLSTLADAQELTGNSFLALRTRTETIAEFQRRRLFWQAGAEIGNLGASYAALGDDANAEKCLLQSLKSAFRFEDSAEKVRVLTKLAQLYVRRGRLAEASRAAKQALLYSSRVKFPRFIPSVLRVQGQVAMRYGRYSEARSYLEESLKLARDMSTAASEAQALLDLGDCYRAVSNMPEAQKVFAEAKAVADRHNLVWMAADASRGLGKIEAARSNWEQAWNYYRAAIDSTEALRAGVPPGDIHLGFSRKSWPVYEEAVDVLAHLGSADVALEITERGRARSFLDQLAKSDAARMPTLVSSKATQELAQSLNAAVVSFVLSEPSSSAWIATPGTPLRMVRLPGRKAIETAVRRYRRSLMFLPAGPSADAYAPQSRRLYDMLLAPLLVELDPKLPLSIVPDGILHYLPFETLSSRPGHFLVEDRSVSYVPSVSVLAALQQAAQETGAEQSREFLAYGDPAYINTGTTAAIYRSAGYHFQQLPHTRVEVVGIGALFRPSEQTLRLGRAASEQSFKQEALAGYRRVHFATHATLDERVAARSGIVLSLVNPGNEDGILHADEIMKLKLNSDLVVLSACRTGLGQLVSGEGMVGLTRAFFHAGARRVAVSLWDVNDQSTAGLMREFYRQMRAGVSPSISLRAAQLSFLRSSTPAYRHPHFWAPFILTGLP